jgi:hypothetical protein
MMKSRKIRLVGHVARMWAKRNAYRLLVGNPEGRRPLGRPKRKWINKLKVDLVEEIKLGELDRVCLAQGRYRWRALVNSVLNLRVSHSAGKQPSDCTAGDLEKRPAPQR